MTPEAQRIAIAKACGWEQIEIAPEPFGGLWGIDPFGRKDEWDQLPDYLSDLNAMNEAETMLKDAQKTTDYAYYLATIYKREHGEHGGFIVYWHATAAQRAEAFLRTLNLWDDTK